MEIIDTQVHLNMVGIEAGLVAMDAAGVDALVIDEFWGFDDNGRPLPSHPLPNGSVRHIQPLAELAVAQHPDRFGYITRAQPDDPELERVIAALRDRPGAVGLRILPALAFPPSDGDEAAIEAFAASLIDGQYDRYLSLATEYEVPVFIQVNGINVRGRLHAIRAVATTHPGLVVVVDAIGVSIPLVPGGRPDRFAQFAELHALAELPNVHVKWSHATRLSEQPYPFEDVRAVLRDTVAAFGADRVMWASDWTLDRDINSWAELYGYIRDDTALTDVERTAVLGGTARRVLGWPTFA